MTSAEPSLLLAVGSLILGLAASILWTITGHLITIAHEGSHALVASATGWSVDHIRVEARQDGYTEFKESSVGFLAALSGYAGPSLFGIAGATLLANGVSPETMLWISFACLVIIFVQMKHVFSLFITALWGVVIFLLVREGSPGVRALAAYTLVWFLLLGGVVQTFVYNAGGRRSDDSRVLKDMTKVPMGFWCALWCMAAVAALVYGGGVLLRFIAPPLG
ncbi:M50 family metallopeptidase [Catenuloplanes japonicus]|uniref:M50 family metallopeptidase n=1 Tax=Catenuloplanes japonicus TaxID=33876 RepID=UPI0005242DC1|nr:M50 family metallopeptidase [Catenuloplanes japonicus]